ncbi:A24 family peptidase [uncultured Tateyamaria sp.]|uniref:prepilin peptidase n=1 Tax=uncultured Tateyamaria sp. TaxID=455651 RepID=UPI0026261F7A|nr:A24 family peptidase [uncultured Tateyamaria sp.]
MTDGLSHTASFAWLASAFLAVVLGWVCVVDTRRFQIPDAASLGLMLSGLALSFLSPVVTPLAAVLGATVGYVAFAGLGTAFYHHTGQDGLGLGDAKLLAAAGAWLGLQDLPMLVGVAAIGALTFAVMTGRRKIAFGPWLSGAFWVIWVVRINA